LALPFSTMLHLSSVGGSGYSMHFIPQCNNKKSTVQ
jgi:hypothetical protein